MKHTTPKAALLTALFLLGLPFEAGAQEVLQGAQDLFDRATESKQTRYRRELEEQDRLRRQEEELRWRRELEERDRQAQQGRRTGAAAPIKAYPPALARGANALRVELFVASDCPECQQLRDFMQEAGVSYELYELDRDPAAEREYLAHIGRGVIPVTRIGSTIVRGFEPDKVRDAISEAKRLNTPARAAGQDSWRADAAGPPPARSGGEATGAVTPQLPPAQGTGRYIPYETSDPAAAPPAKSDPQPPSPSAEAEEILGADRY